MTQSSEPRAPFVPMRATDGGLYTGLEEQEQDILPPAYHDYRNRNRASGSAEDRQDGTAISEPVTVPSVSSRFKFR